MDENTPRQQADGGFTAALDALRAIHDRLWDDDAWLDRLPPGATPGFDLSELNLHTVRETALGAFLDLSDGKLSRARAGIDRVLHCQYRERSMPWTGTFKCTAEERDPPRTGANEWVDYDPNWRQFLGCVLAYTLDCYESALSIRLRDAIEESVGLCVTGEPADRIPDWYTNPNLLHAWLCGWLGRRRDDRQLIASAEEKVTTIMRRLVRYGDVDEYNSPTYDGVDLLALGLWCTRPPTGSFEEAGHQLAQAIGSRLSRLYHPGLGAICGPYVRAYGVSLDRYVSLAGIWLAAAGASSSRVMPPHLDVNTPHVHDLYFLPVIGRLAEPITPYLTLDDVTTPRHHGQRFKEIRATSRLAPDQAVGGEQGRIPRFARDQYFPYTAHFHNGPDTAAIGVKLGDATDAVDAVPSGDSQTILYAEGKDDAVELILVCSDEPDIEGYLVSLGRHTFAAGSAPADVACERTPYGVEVRINWSVPRVVIDATITPT